MRKAKQPLLYAASSVSSWVIDEGVFYLLMRLFGAAIGGAATTVFSLAARALSSFYNFNLNRLVFQSRDHYGKALLRYYCLVGVIALLMTVLLNAFTALLHIESAEGKAMVKMGIDAGLFVVSFFAQKYWVFHKHDTNAA